MTSFHGFGFSVLGADLRRKMNACGKVSMIGLLALMGGLAACSSAPSDNPAYRLFNAPVDPYWDDQRWAKALLDAVEAVAHDPVVMTDTTTIGPHVIIKFTFANGMIQDPAIIAGTGDPSLDELLLKQVITAQVPRPGGAHANEPHGFLLDLDMLTPYESFEDSVYTAIDAAKVYPKDALLSGAIGAATLGFDYLDGKATGIAIVTSSRDRYLDKSSLAAVANALMPPAPPAYAGKTLHMEVTICYNLNNSKNCQIARNVVLVRGTLVRR